MSQYQTGTVTLISGSQSVSGEGTAWLTNASVGDLLKKRNENAIYIVGAVTSNTTMTLTANYAGTSCSGEEYTLVRDFTDNYNIPEIWPGDRDWAYHLTYGLRIIDNEINSVSAEANLTDTIVDHSTATAVSLDSDDYNKVHLFSASAGVTVCNLPTADSDDVGKWLDFRKRGASELYLHRSGEGTIFGETRCLNETDETFASIVLQLETSTTFGTKHVLGNWKFTSTGEAL